MFTTKSKNAGFNGFSTFSSEKLTKLRKNSNIQFVMLVFKIIQNGKYFLNKFYKIFVEFYQAKS
jgi:hypothetical protein